MSKHKKRSRVKRRVNSAVKRQPRPTKQSRVTEIRRTANAAVELASAFNQEPPIRLLIVAPLQSEDAPMNHTERVDFFRIKESIVHLIMVILLVLAGVRLAVSEIHSILKEVDATFDRRTEAKHSRNRNESTRRP